MHVSRPAARRLTLLATTLVLPLALVVAACGGGGGSASTTTVSTAASSSSTTRAPSSTSTATTLPAPPPTPLTIAHGASATEADGSGCNPTGDALPDGLWFGVLMSVDVAGNSFGLDLACLYTGAAADAQSVARGGPSPVPNGYYISNQSTKVFTVPAWSNIQIVPLQLQNGYPTGGMAAATTGITGAQAILTYQGPKLVWTKITGGRAIVLQAQFTP